MQLHWTFPLDTIIYLMASIPKTYTQPFCHCEIQIQKATNGNCLSPNMFQEVMSKLLGNLDYETVYIDGILIIQKEDESDESHLEKIEVVLGKLEQQGFEANLKSPSLCRRKLNI